MGHLTLIEQILAWFVSISASLFAIWKGTKKWRKRWYNHYIAGRTARYDLLNAKLDKITHQLYPNGGSSLNDMITQVKSEMVIQKAMILDIKEGQRITREVLDMIHWESDDKGRVTWVSTNLCDLLNCNQNQILGTSWTGMVSNEDRRRIFDAWKFSVENASYFKEEFDFINSDGEKVRVRATTRHTKDEKQKLIKSLVRFVQIN